MNQHCTAPSKTLCGGAGTIDPLAPLAYALADAAAGLRQLSSARAIGKIVTSAQPTPAQESTIGRWLVSGGLGALGSLSARHVLDCGCVLSIKPLMVAADEHDLAHLHFTFIILGLPRQAICWKYSHRLI